MNRAMACVLHGLSSRLPAEERDAVDGDLREMQFGYFRRLRELAGLLARRELEAWSNWQCWIGLAAIALVVAPSVNGLSRGVIMWPVQYLRVYARYGVLYQSGLSFEREAVSWCFQTLAVVLFAWSAGKALSRLLPDGPTPGPLRVLLIWTGWNGLIAIGPLARGAPFFGVMFFLILNSVLFLLPAVHGATDRGPLSHRRSIAFLAAAVVMVGLLTWSGGWWQASIIGMNGGYVPDEVPWYMRMWPWLLAAWPAAYLSFDGFRKRVRTI